MIIEPRGPGAEHQGMVMASTKLLLDNASTTCRQNHLVKKWKTKLVNFCLFRQIAQILLYLIIICSGRCSTPWPRKTLETATNSAFSCPTSSSRSRPSSWRRALIFCVDVGEKLLIKMVNTFCIKVLLFCFYDETKFMRKRAFRTCRPNRKSQNSDLLFSFFILKQVYRKGIPFRCRTRVKPPRRCRQLFANTSLAFPQFYEIPK